MVSNSKQRRNRKKHPEVTNMLVWDIPKHVKDTFKTRCVRAGVSMRKAVIRFMRDFRA